MKEFGLFLFEVQSLFKYFAVVCFCVTLHKGKAQVYFNMGDYRNAIILSNGVNNTFANTSVGFARREYLKRLKREIIGILEVSLNESHQSFTRHIIRKALQTNLYTSGDFRIPFMFASSSIIRYNQFVKYHDITAEFALNPGRYTEKYSIAADIRYELIAFRHFRYSSQYRHDKDAQAHNHWNEPMTNLLKLGLAGALNFNRTSLVLKMGYEDNPFIKQYPFLSVEKFRWYAIAGIVIKFGKNPLARK